MTALVTGASSGIGEAFARQIHAKGARIIAVARREDRLEALCEHLNAIRPASARAIAVDLEKDCDALIAELRDTRIDVLVNNAGRGMFGDFASVPEDVDLSMVALNVTAPLRLLHAFVPGMKERQQGGIISIASLAAFVPLPFMSGYAATKSFNLIHSLALREELKDSGVRVLTVCPGPLATEFGAVAGYPQGTLALDFDTVEACVRQSVRAFERNRACIIPGHAASLLGLARLIPLRLRALCAGHFLRARLP